MAIRVVHKRCAGLDVHKKTVVACVLFPGGSETKTFGTSTSAVRKLADWLLSHGVTHVAMESTHVYWKPLWNLLEEIESVTPILVNAHHLKKVPGRKTDVKDAEWIADLLRHGLVKGSFVPSRSLRELRELTRRRRTVIRLRSSEVQRLQASLEGANIKLSSVITDIMGVTGTAIIEAMANGEKDPAKLADLAHPRIQATREELIEALEGFVGEHQRFMFTSTLRLISALDAEIQALDQEVSTRLRPFQETIERVTESTPGFGRRAVEEILAETGPDMATFDSSKQLASWARICPGSNNSGGKRGSGKTGRGNPWLFGILKTTAMAGVKVRGSYYNALYKRHCARGAKAKARTTVMHQQLVDLWHMIRRKESYRKPEPAPKKKPVDRETATRRAVQELVKLGFDVTLTDRRTG